MCATGRVHGGIEVVVPTRNRPDKLAKCLEALAAARQHADFRLLVCDSSDDARHAEVQSVISSVPFVRLVRHDARNVAAARNVCAREASAEVIVNVDDDVYVEPLAIATLGQAHEQAPSPSVVAGSVSWNGEYSTPVTMRYIGYGRPTLAGETPSFLVGAFFIYARTLALALPWNERIRCSDDRFMGALWRRHDVRLGYAPSARAAHDAEFGLYKTEDQQDHIYVNLFDALVANRNLTRALAYEILGFAAGARLYARTMDGARQYTHAWLRGHRNLWRDRGYLRELVSRELPRELVDGTCP